MITVTNTSLFRKASNKCNAQKVLFDCTLPYLRDKQPAKQATQR